MPADAGQYHIHVLPMPVLVGEETFYEGCNITSEEFYQKLASGEPVTTSQPSPADVMKMWDQLLKEHDEVVHVQGFTGAQIKATLEQEALDATIYIAVDTLEYLKKGGRITAAAAAIGTVLNLKPVLTIQGDKLDAYTKTRGMKSAFKAMCKALDKDLAGRLATFHDQGQLKAGIAYTQMDTDTLEFFREEMKKRYPDLELFQLPLTMSIGSHTGPGALGIGLVRFHKN